LYTTEAIPDLDELGSFAIMQNTKALNSEEVAPPLFTGAARLFS
jgi:hypothetical protein